MYRWTEKKYKTKKWKHQQMNVKTEQWGIANVIFGPILCPLNMFTMCLDSILLLLLSTCFCSLFLRPLAPAVPVKCNPRSQRQMNEKKNVYKYGLGQWLSHLFNNNGRLHSAFYLYISFTRPRTLAKWMKINFHKVK